MEIILKGVGSGIALALMIGPVFFSLLQTSVERGFRNGAWMALGVSMSDTLYILICYLGLSSALSSDAAQQYMAYAGGFILLLFGLYYLVIKSRRPLEYKSVNVYSTSPLQLIMKGFIINGLSPMVIIFWLGIVSVVTSEFGYSSYRAGIFFSSVIGTVFLTDLLKAKMAAKLRQVLTVRFIRILNVVLGIGMLGFALRMLIYAYSFRVD